MRTGVTAIDGVGPWRDLHARPSGRGRWLVAPCLLAVALLAFAITAAPAAATNSHHFAGTIDTGTDPVTGGPCNVWDLDVDAQENVYVICGGSQLGNNFSSGAVVKKFDKNGNPVPFTANLPYIQGNTLLEDPYPEAKENEYGKTFQNEGKIAVDTSSGPTAGYIYIITSSHLDVLKPSGQFVASLSAAGAFGLNSVAADAEGNVYYNSGFKIDKRDQSLAVVAQLYDSTGNGVTSAGSEQPASQDMAFDSTGAVWGVGTADPLGGFEADTIARWEADQFRPPEQESTFSLGNHRKAKMSPLVEAPLKAFGSEEQLKATSISVDRSDDTLFVETSDVFGTQPRHILQFTRGTEDEPSHQLGAPIGDNSNIGPTTVGGNAEGVAVASGGTVFVAAGSEGISKFVAGGPLPTVRDHRVALADVGHTDVTVRAEVELAGGGPITECEVRYGTTREYDRSAPCVPDPSGSNFDEDTAISAHLTGLTTGTEYHAAVVASNAEGTGYGIDRTFSPAAVLDLNTSPATDITDSTATFRGSFDPDGISTTYHFEYGLAGELTASTEESAPVEGSGELPVAVPVTNLGTGKEYQYRLVATNSLGTTRGPIQSFTVAGPPTIFGVHASNVGSEEADLGGRINTLGYPTTYKFEYGPTAAYGSVAPASGEGDAGEGTQTEGFQEHVSGLEPGRVYHFRLVATNRWGTTTSDDTTFNYLPAPCPNEHVRQEMKSSFLPDCRAYELVSPENAGGAQIYPGSEAYVAGAKGFPSFHQIGDQREIQNTGLANNPPRFAYYVGLGGIASLDAPTAFLDLYTATRTDEGWKTSFSGISGREYAGTAHKTCSISLDLCLDHIRRNAFTEGEEPNNWGYLFNLNDEKLGPVPTNLESVENGVNFIGDIRNSPDLSHFAFSSRNVAFAEGGVTESPGSAYDNDLKTGTVKIISTLPDGEPIPYGGVANEFITIPPTGVSRDGSHILMETHAPDGPNRLYMSVNDGPAYEVSEGHGVTFIGMTPDGSKVLFLATQQLLPEDTDESADIYMWHENEGSPPSLTLVTQGDGAGNSDACQASWTEKCSVELLKTQNGDRTGFSEPLGLRYQDVTLGGTDSKLASSSGGVFFFSPDVLAGSAPHNGKNLYFANNGEIHYVATLAGSQTIDRIQISPDGEHAGFLTRARLTSYENENFEEMYSYTPGTGRLICVSCRLDGLPPTADVEASQNGPFMSDDGRVFFATSDPLVPADADPYGIPDVYEYVEGRPQLISSGTSSNGKAPGGAGAFVAETLGLESVSSTGQDVFFSTTDTMVPQDANGNFAKIYDARTDGGFEVAAKPAPCVAADECHGAGAPAPGPLQIGTGSTTSGGNLPATKRHRTCRATHRHRTRHGRGAHSHNARRANRAHRHRGCGHGAKKHRSGKRHARLKGLRTGHRRGGRS